MAADYRHDKEKIPVMVIEPVLTNRFVLHAQLRRGSIRLSFLGRLFVVVTRQMPDAVGDALSRADHR